MRQIRVAARHRVEVPVRRALAADSKAKAVEAACGLMRGDTIAFATSTLARVRFLLA